MAGEGPSPEGDDVSMTTGETDEHEKVDHDPYDTATDVSSLHQGPVKSNTARSTLWMPLPESTSILSRYDAYLTMYTKEVSVVDDLAVSLALAFAGDVPVKEEPIDTEPHNDVPTPPVASDGHDGTPKTSKRVLSRRDAVLNAGVASTKKKILLPQISTKFTRRISNVVL